MTTAHHQATWPAGASQPAETTSAEQAMYELARRHGVEEDLRRAEAISQFLVDAGEAIGRAMRAARNLFGTLRRTAL